VHAFSGDGRVPERAGVESDPGQDLYLINQLSPDSMKLALKAVAAKATFESSGIRAVEENLPVILDLPRNLRRRIDLQQKNPIATKR